MQPQWNHAWALPPLGVVNVTPGENSGYEYGTKSMYPSPALPEPVAGSPSLHQRLDSLPRLCAPSLEICLDLSGAVSGHCKPAGKTTASIGPHRE